MNAQIEIEFERECLMCYGRGVRLGEERCRTCDGLGHIPTELGDKLLEFLERRGLKLSAQRKDGAG
jgi:DnaJ-class molecular chaperone